MNEYRITKYNPKFRNKLGHYQRDEWLDYSEIGRDNFWGGLLTYERYKETEESYINVILYIIQTKKLKYVRIKNLYISSGSVDKNTSPSMLSILKEIKDKDFIEVSKVPDLCRLILRNQIWGRIYTINLFVHFGYDYYMYVGFTGKCDGLSKKVKECGLFIEKFESPYKRASDSFNE